MTEIARKGELGSETARCPFLHHNNILSMMRYAQVANASYKLTQREVAAELGLGTGAAVSLQLRRLREALADDKTLRRQLQAIDFHLLSFKG